MATQKSGRTSRENTQIDKAYQQVSGGRRPSARQIAERKKAAKNRKVLIIGICSVILVILISLIVFMIVHALRPTDDGRILNNVYAAGINLGGMTAEEARNALHLATDNTFTKKDMVITLPDGTIVLSPANTGASLDVDKVVEAAYNYGRDGSDAANKKAQQNADKTMHTIALLSYMKLDTAYIQNTLRTFCSSYSSAMTQPTIILRGERPVYKVEIPDDEAPDEESPDEDVPNEDGSTEAEPEKPTTSTKPVVHQVLTITMGTPDYRLDYNRLYELVLDAYSLNEMEITYSAPTQTEPERPVAQELFDRYCVLPENARLDEHLNVVPEVFGYGFDVAALQKRLDNAAYGETIQLTLNFLEPEITSADLEDSLPVDILAQFTCTNGDVTKGWATNMLLACEKINNTILNKGEIFSFNDLVGRPTEAKGFQKAPGFRSGAEENILGAGIEQVASALYYCALISDLEILERHSNGYAPGYIDKGLDAYISYNSQDLKFVNNTDDPIRIEASAKGGSVTVTIYGIDSRMFDIEIVTEVLNIIHPGTVFQNMDKDNVLGYEDGHVLVSGITGYEVAVYRVKRNKQTGDMVSKMEVNTSKYSARNEKVVRIEPEQVVDPSTPGGDPVMPPEDPIPDEEPQD